MADSLRPLVPGFTSADEITLRLLSLVLVRIELAEAWLAEQGTIMAPGKKGDVFNLVKEMSRWESQAAKLCSALGLSPQARSRMRADAAAGRASAAALEEHLASTYAVGGDE